MKLTGLFLLVDPPVQAQDGEYKLTIYVAQQDPAGPLGGRERKLGELTVNESMLAVLRAVAEKVPDSVEVHWQGYMPTAAPMPRWARGAIDLAVHKMLT